VSGQAFLDVAARMMAARFGWPAIMLGRERHFEQAVKPGATDFVEYDLASERMRLAAAR
jgi:hypothetical protein